MYSSDYIVCGQQNDGFHPGSSQLLKNDVPTQSNALNSPNSRVGARYMCTLYVYSMSSFSLCMGRTGVYLRARNAYIRSHTLKRHEIRFDIIFQNSIWRTPFSTAMEHGEHVIQTTVIAMLAEKYRANFHALFFNSLSYNLQFSITPKYAYQCQHLFLFFSTFMQME